MHKSHKKKNQRAKIFMNKNRHATSSMNKISFMKRKINMQQVSRKKSAGHKFQEQNQFHEENSQHLTNFMNKNQHATSTMKKINFMRRKINIRQLSRTKIGMQHVSLRK